MARGEGVYEDRDDAGAVLAAKLEEYRGRATVVLAIPNGGVPVGLRVRNHLGADFGVLVVRKLHIPWNREAGFGAVAPDGSVVFNEDLRQGLGLTPEEEGIVLEEERREIARRMAAYRAHELPPIRGRVAILVDDGLASGSSMWAAANFVRRQSPRTLVVAVPTASESGAALVSAAVDRLVCPSVRRGPVFAVADAYRHWYDLEDADVVALLRNAGVLGGGRASPRQAKD